MIKYYVDSETLGNLLRASYFERLINHDAVMAIEKKICSLTEPDRIEITRCEDCRYYNAYVDYPMGDCMYWVMEEDLPIRLPVYGNDFCSCGKSI